MPAFPNTHNIIDVLDALGGLQLLKRVIEWPAASEHDNAGCCLYADKIAEGHERIRAQARQAYHVALMAWSVSVRAL